MTEYRLLRIIGILERVRTPRQELIPLTEEDASWNILLYLTKQSLVGTPVTISSLASAANIPYATAMRRIHELIDEGYIFKKPTSETGKSFNNMS